MNQIQFLKKWLFAIILVINYPVNGKTLDVSSVPVDPISAIIDAFNTYRVVALDEGNHGNEQSHNFRMDLIYEPKFSEMVNDIIVEFGSSTHQKVMDRFIFGENVSYSELRKVWLDTTSPHLVWDVPIYEEFFRGVRKLNFGLKQNKKIRILLAQPPIEWNKITNKIDFLQARKKFNRDLFATNLIKKEVISKGRKALIIYGGMHLLRKHLIEPTPINTKLNTFLSSSIKSIVGLLEKEDVRVFSIWTNTHTDLSKIQSDILKWKVPSLTLLKQTKLGLEPFSSYYFPFPYPYNIEKTKPPTYPRMQEIFDAVLYLGNKNSITYSNLSRELCEDKVYLKLRLKRLSFMGWEERLKKICKLNMSPNQIK